MRGNSLTCTGHVKDLDEITKFGQLSPHTGWQLLRSYPLDELGNKEHSEFENTSWRLDGTDLALLFPLRMIYTTRPSQDLQNNNYIIECFMSSVIYLYSLNNPSLQLIVHSMHVATINFWRHCNYYGDLSMFWLSVRPFRNFLFLQPRNGKIRLYRTIGVHGIKERSDGVYAISLFNVNTLKSLTLFYFCFYFTCSKCEIFVFFSSRFRILSNIYDYNLIFHSITIHQVHAEIVN
uniref:Uncharacterized protein n=1 Tax=Heterorhabditis bacteriophora TaxID=37862 RepID=A0A1I7WE16_HETBA